MSLDRLHEEVAEIGIELTGQEEDKLDHAFVVWFAEARLTGKRETARQGLVGGPKDGGVDAVYVHDEPPVVEIVQGKYTQPGASHNKAVHAFLKVGLDLMDRGSSEKWAKLNALAAEQLTAAHKAIHNKGYRLALYFATTGSVSPGAVEDAQLQAKKATIQLLDVYDKKRLPAVLEDWLQGVPPLPEMQVRIADAMPLHYCGSPSDPEAYVCTVSGQELVNLFEAAGKQLFARNLRGYLDDSRGVNAAMKNTAKHEPETFWFLNNGITMIADKAKHEGDASGHLLRVWNPQVVNGQQTIRTLARCQPCSPAVRCVLRLIVLPPSQNAEAGLRGLAAKVVRGANRQNSIRPADLMANDEEQVRIERKLERDQYLYLRKRETKSPVPIGYQRVYPEDLANAVAVTTTGSFQIVGQNRRWEEAYEKLFSSKRAMSDYLARWHLADWLRYWGLFYDADKQRPARWAITAVLWLHLGIGDALKTASARERFVRMSRCDPSSFKPLASAAGAMYVLAGRLYAQEAKALKAAAKKAGLSTKVQTAQQWFRLAGTPDRLLNALQADKPRWRKVRQLTDEFIAAVSEP